MLTSFLIIGFSAVGLHTVTDWQLPRARYTRRGGMRFFRIGKLQFSFCVCRESI
jgi:hypothetical protein